jgi:hypothetical protein
MDVAEHYDLLRRYITLEEPFGPSNSEKIVADFDAARLLFDKENRIYGQLKKRTTFIVGRRGAGKTHFLYSEYYNGSNAHIFDFHSSKEFGEILRTIDSKIKRPFLIEEIADLWKMVFQMYFMIALSESLGLDDLPQTREYLKGIGLKQDEPTHAVLTGIVKVIGERLVQHSSVVAAMDHLQSRTAGSSYRMAFDEIVGYLSGSRKSRCVLLIDSLDGLHEHIEHVPHAISGLLKCISMFNHENESFQIRFCVPTELYHTLTKLSSNSSKDFESELSLQWHAGELFAIMAKRIQIYARLYSNGLWNQIKDYDPEDRDEAKEVFYSIFPKTVINGLKSQEDTLAYILRHTQLLPRQLFRILNSIVNVNVKAGGDYEKIAPESVRRGIAGIERNICNEICSGYKGVYSNAFDICERCIPELHLTFSYGELQQVYTQFGKKVDGSGNDFFHFRQQLVEIGAIGCVVDDSDSRYIFAEFEYGVPNRLNISSYDTMCLHPIFAGTFSSPTLLKSEKRAIYPRGADIDSLDERKFG